MAEGLRKKRRGWIVWLLLLAGAGAGAVAWKKRHQPPGVAVRAWRVRRGSVRDLVSSVSTGRVAALREATLRAEVIGRVVRLHHHRGDRVAAGEALISYDTADLRDRLRAAETGVLVAAAQRAQAEASARLAERNAARAAVLRERGVAPAADADNLAGQAEVAQRAVTAAEAARAQGLATAGVTRGALGRAVVRAPFAGIVLSTHVEEGEVVALGAPILNLADDAAMHLDTDLDEADLGRIRLGVPVEISLDAYPGERLGGTLDEIAPSVGTDLRGNRSIAIRVAIAADARLRIGMSADADVVVATRNDVVFVPPTAVIGRGTERAVFVVAGGIAHRRVVHTGISTWEAVEVGDGVVPGDMVVVNTNVEGLVEGARVRVTTVDAAEAARR